MKKKDSNIHKEDDKFMCKENSNLNMEAINKYMNMPPEELERLMEEKENEIKEKMAKEENQ